MDKACLSRHHFRLSPMANNKPRPKETTFRGTIEELSLLVNRSVKELKRWAGGGLIESEKSPNGTIYVLREPSRFFPGNSSLDSATPRVVSFFSGCGGLDLGFEKAGFNIGFANDFFLDACLSYSANVGNIDPRPIQEITPEETGPAEVLLAGFPCQPFSNAGSRRGVSDPRGTLFWETLKFVDALRPSVVVFENVRGLLSMRNPDGGKLIEAIENELHSRGYEVNHKLVNTKDYGVPQNRYRVIIVGIRSDLNKGSFDFDLIEGASAATVGEVLSIPVRKGDPNDEHWTLSPQSVDLVKHIPEGGSWKAVPYDELPVRLKKIRDDMQRYHSPNFYRRFARNEIMGTVTAAATPENSGILHPTEPRRYTVREVARFQTFPEDYVFMGKSIAAKYKQIGNAVPPEFAKRLALAIKRHIGLSEDS